MSMEDTQLARLMSYASRRHFVISAAEASALDVDPRAMHRAVVSGALTRVHPGVYRVGSAPMTDRARALAAVLYVGGNAVVSRETAAQLWELPLRTFDGRVHVTNDVRSGPAPPSIVLHRTRRFLEGHCTLFEEHIPITTVERTICDLAMEYHVTKKDVRRIVSTAVRRELITSTSLLTMLEDLARFRGRPSVVRAAAELSDLETHTRSELESRFLDVTTRAGIPPTTMNYPVSDINGDLRYLDAVWLPERLAVELDSAAFHRLATDQTDDRERGNAVLLVGWHGPLRFTWWDVTERSDRMVSTIQSGLRVARATIRSERVPVDVT